MYPAYSKLQNDLEGLKSAYLKLVKHIFLISVPFCFGVILLGGQFLRCAYGEKWLGAFSVMKILAFAGLFNVILTSNEAILVAQGKSKISFWLYFIQVTFFLIFIKPAGRLFDLNGVGMIVTGASFFAMLLSFFWVSKALSLNLKEIYRSFQPSLVCSLLISVSLIIAQSLLGMNSVSKFVTFKISFILLSVFAITGYAFLIHKIDPTLFTDIKKITSS